MKRNVLSFCAAVLLSVSAANAQSGAQLRAGINLANVSVTGDGDVDDAKMLTSFQLGMVGDISLGGILAFQPGVIFTGKGSKTEAGSSSSNTYFKATSNPYYIEVPANLVVKLPVGTGTKFFVGAGPYLGIGVGGKNKTEGKYLGASFKSEQNIEFSNDDPTTFNYEENAGLGVLKRFDYGLNGTAGIDGKSIVLGVHYGLGLAKLQSGSNSGEDKNNKHRVLSFTVGFKL